MTPIVNLDGKDRVAQAAPAPAPTLPAERAAAPAAHEPTYAERQGMAMGWVAITMGIFVLLAGLALWAAAVFNAGFAGWLVAVCVMGIIVVAALIAVSQYVMRPMR